MVSHPQAQNKRSPTKEFSWAIAALWLVQFCLKLLKKNGSLGANFFNVYIHKIFLKSLTKRLFFLKVSLTFYIKKIIRNGQPINLFHCSNK
jgi:hypothetical protein